jgi:quercetin dioxygenase-like cupin family protein
MAERLQSSAHVPFLSDLDEPAMNAPSGFDGSTENQAAAVERGKKPVSGGAAIELACLVDTLRRVAAATCSGPGEGERLWFLGTLATIRTPGEATEGRFALIEFLFPRHASPPLHTHPQDESYIVVEGRLTVQAGERRFALETGAAAVVPMGVAHTFRVESDTARVLVLSTPAGLERMVRAAAEPAVTATLPPPETPRPSSSQLDEIFRAHGQVNLGPPLAPED